MMGGGEKEKNNCSRVFYFLYVTSYGARRIYYVVLPRPMLACLYSNAISCSETVLLTNDEDVFLIQIIRLQ
jgi:hypothetical protein